MTRNSIRWFSENELKAALALVGTPESAASVAAELFALPEEEQRCYNWINTTLMLLSCVSDDLARRVLEHFGDTPAAHARHVAEQETGREWIARRRGEPKVEWVLEDVVHDGRQDAAFMRDFRSARPERLKTNYIPLFTEFELREALFLVAERDASASVAAEIFGLPDDQQVTLNWTDFSLGLLSSSSSELGERIETAFGDTAERREQLREMRLLFRDLIANGELKALGAHLDRNTIVRFVRAEGVPIE